MFDRRFLVRSRVPFEERDRDETTVERLRLVLRGRQLVDAKDAQATTLDVPHLAVLDVELDPVMSHPRLEHSSSPQEVADFVLIGEDAESTAQRLRKKRPAEIGDRKRRGSPSSNEVPQELDEGALAVRSGRGVQENSLIERVTRTEQGSNNPPEQSFDLGIIVRKLPDPLVNAPPINHRARGGVFTEGNGGLRREDNLGRERAQLLRT